MPTKYTRDKFQTDLKNLHALLNKKNVNKKTSQKGGVKSKKSAKKSTDSETRHFKVVEVNGRKHEMGRYSGKVPQQAAKKAVTRICTAKKMSKDNCSITFSIQEMSQGSDKKIYGPYKAKLVKNPKEKWVKLGDSWVGKHKVVIKEM